MSDIYWITPADLGTFAAGYDFNLNANQLRLYCVADNPTFIILNGSLPDGMVSNIVANEVTLSGVINNTLSTTMFEFTYRVIDVNGIVADRTFYLTSVVPPAVPNWDNQSVFLGYFPENTQLSITIAASVSTNVAITYSNVSILPDNMSISSTSGIISYYSPDIASDTITMVSNTWRATSQGVSNDTTLSIGVVSIPHAPVWETSPGLVYSIGQGMTVSFQLSAFESSGGVITYGLLDGYLLPVGLILSSDGLLYGVAPTVLSNTIYEFTVIAASINGETPLLISIEVLLDALHDQVVFNSPNDIGILFDGRYYDIDVSASSNRATSLRYGITGGHLPPGLTLDTTHGRLQGFLEYQVLAKTYEWNQIAFDGVEHISRMSTMQVQPSTNGMYWGIALPFTGPSRVYIDQQLTLPVVLPQQLDIMNGFSWTSGNLQQIINTVSSNFRNLDLSIGVGSYTNIDSMSNTVWLTSIVDQQQGADYSDSISTNVAIYGSQLSTRPGSLDNWRRYLTSSYGFITAGTPNINTAAAVASVDAESTGLASVQLIDVGYDFSFAPILSCISPSGNSAILSSTITLADYQITNGGFGWEVGTILAIPYGDFTSPAIIKIANVLVNGVVTNINIISNGSYTNFPSGPQLISGSNGQQPFSIQLIFQLGAITILSAGDGYNPNTQYSINILGNELLPQWQTNWLPQVPMAWTNLSTSIGSTANTIAALSSQQGVALYANHAVISVVGKRWTGTTSWAIDNITFDGARTQFIEYTEPHATIFDSNRDTYDLNSTVFDVVPSNSVVMVDTQFDDNTTMYDMFATIFDSIPPITSSTTEVRRLFVIPTQQISGHNYIINKMP